MNDLSPKERILRIFNKQIVDRPPVICPGGMMNSAIVEIMNKTGNRLPEGHHDSSIMTSIAEDVYKYTGFENIGVPFCMTIESEVLGSSIDYGSISCEPKIYREAFSSTVDVIYKELSIMHKNSRVQAVAESIYHLSKEHVDVPVIGSITGPISTSASIITPSTFFRELIRKPSYAHKLIDYTADNIIEFAKLMIENGVTAISIADPTATGEILGPNMFREYALRYINKIVDAIHKMDIPVIVHICGNMNIVKKYIPKIRADAVSVDASVNLSRLKQEYPQLTTMGNMSTFLLELGDEQTIHLQTERLLQKQIDIIAPACGLSTSTPLKNIISMTQAVKEY